MKITFRYSSIVTGECIVEVQDGKEIIAVNVGERSTKYDSRKRFIYFSQIINTNLIPIYIQYRSWALVAAVKISEIYGLEVSVFERDEIKDEIWIHTSTVTPQIYQLTILDVNSDDWHYLRDRLCGIPEYKIDPQFHLRKGYNQPCDKV